jgi:hypothetical protein
MADGTALPAGSRFIPAHFPKSDRVAYVVVDESDYDWLSSWRWRVHKDGYAYRQEHTGEVARSGRPGLITIMMHRQIMDTPPGMDTDHKNRNRLDNRRSNLRIVDRAQNNYNTGVWANNTSGHKGISWNKRTKSWRAYIGGGGPAGKRIELGHFKNIEDAIAARVAAEEKVIDKCA